MNYFDKIVRDLRNCDDDHITEYEITETQKFISAQAARIAELEAALADALSFLGATSEAELYEARLVKEQYAALLKKGEL